MPRLSLTLPAAASRTPSPSASRSLARARSTPRSHAAAPAAQSRRSLGQLALNPTPALAAPSSAALAFSTAPRNPFRATSATELAPPSFSSPICPFPFRHPKPASVVARRDMATATPAGGAASDPAAAGAIGADVPDQTADSASTSGVTASLLEERLRSKLEVTEVAVEDISGGCGQSFAATIVSPAFQGKMTLARHRLVNAALRDEIALIHAWTPKCLTPEEWAKRQGQ